MRMLQTHNGQALVELAVFGTFFLMLLGVLLSYGLKYNFQQKAQMTAFRRALKIASDQDRGTGSAMIMEDRTIPDPATMFGIGSTAPIVASASVQRDYKMDEQPFDADSLSGSVMDIQTSRNGSTNAQAWMRRIYKTSAFRVEYLVPPASLDKYEQIFGSLLALKTGSSITDADPWVSTSSSDAEMTCLASHEETDESGVPSTFCDNEVYAAIRIIDACSGEISDYETCYSQARQLVDPEFCQRKCELAKIPGSDIVCSTVCGQVTNPPNQTVKTYDSTMGGAWYAAEWEAPTTATPPAMPTSPNYNFPYLSGYRGDGSIVPALFSFVGARSPSDPVKQMVMGLQSDITQNTVRSESIDKTETTSAISTQEDAVWTDTLNRTLVHQDNIASDGFENVPASGQPADFANVTTDNVISEVSGSISQAQQTAK